jgi:hypothetical protein
MRKPNWLDYTIIFLIIAIIAGGVWFLSRNKIGQISEESTVIEFTVEVSKVPIEVCSAYQAGKNVVFGTKNAASGVIYNVEIVPFTQDMPNQFTGNMQKVEVEGLYDAHVTIQTNGIVTDHAIKSGEEVLNVGVEMTFHGKGIAGKGYIISIKTPEEV